jgi:heme/copper-type cytochrome/quinol oxidase subunit 2
MGIGTSLFLIAVGAILNWAVTATVAGININTVGVILMVVGIAGLVISLLYASIWSDRRAGTAADRPPVRERDVY